MRMRWVLWKESWVTSCGTHEYGNKQFACNTNLSRAKKVVARSTNDNLGAAKLAKSANYASSAGFIWKVDETYARNNESNYAKNYAGTINQKLIYNVAQEQQNIISTSCPLITDSAMSVISLMAEVENHTQNVLVLEN